MIGNKWLKTSSRFEVCLPFILKRLTVLMLWQTLNRHKPLEVTCTVETLDDPRMGAQAAATDRRSPPRLTGLIVAPDARMASVHDLHIRSTRGNVHDLHIMIFTSAEHDLQIRSACSWCPKQRTGVAGSESTWK